MTAASSITIREMIDRTADYFQQKGIESARLDAQLLIAHALEKTRLQLYLQFDYPVDETELARARELVRRRAAREPVAYIIGTREFAGRDFKVQPGVLIPRPDTEVLIEEVQKELTARFGVEQEEKAIPEESAEMAEIPEVSNEPAETEMIPAGSQKPQQPDAEPLRILEFGIGSGAIAVTLAANEPRIHVTATEISSAAAQIAHENATRHEVADRIDIRQQPDFAGISGPFHAIVSNPPYIDPVERPTLAPEVEQHEPPEALFADDAGLRWYKFIASQAAAFLVPNGFIAVEIGYKQRLAVEEIFENAGLRVIRSTKDYAGHYRVVMAAAG